MKQFLAIVILALTAATANAITYHVDRDIGISDSDPNVTGTVTGTITIRDGASGVLGFGDFESWSLTLTAKGLNVSPTTETDGDFVIDAFDQDSSTLRLNGDAVTATDSGLFYDFSFDGQLLFLTDSRNFWCLETSNCSLGPDLSEQIGRLEGVRPDSVAIEWDQYTAQNTISFAVIPVPAAVWLFGSGLLGLIGLARIRR